MWIYYVAWGAGAYAVFLTAKYSLWSIFSPGRVMYVSVWRGRMVPFHDTDVEGERWSQAEWVNYELWEKVEIRKKRRKRLLLLAAAFIWFCLSAVPILTERWPRWIARSLIRHCAQQVNQVKLEAVIRKAPVRIRFQGLAYTMEVVHSCQDAQGVEIRSGTLSHHRESQFRVLQAEDGLLPIVSDLQNIY